MEIIKKYKKSIFIFSLLLAVGAVIWGGFAGSDLPKYDYSINDWVSEYAVYENNGLSVGEKIKDTRVRKVFLWGPYKYLKKGSYTVRISYSTEEDQSCLATASGGAAQLFNSSEGILSHHFHNAEYQFETIENVDEFQLVFYYNGIGNFTVHSISIVPGNSLIKRTVAVIIFVSIVLSLIAAASSWSKNRLLTAAALLCITLFISFPLAMKGIPNGDDLGVHYLRIEAIVQAIRSKQFPARISGVTLFGLGYPFSIYYNDIFLYFPAVLRLLGFSVNTAYKIYLISVNFLTVIISWFSFEKIFKKRKLSMLLTLLYVTASYRMLNIWTRGAVGEYTAQTFLPLLTLALYNIYTCDSKSFRSLFNHSVLLAAAMSGIIGSHLLTSLMSCFVIVVVCLCFWRKTFRAWTILTYLTAVLLAIIVNLYFLVPFTDYYFNVPTNIRSSLGAQNVLIQSSGAFPMQFINFFQSTDGEQFLPIEGRLQCTPGLPLMVMLCFGIYFWICHKRTPLLNFSLFFSLFLLFLSSDMFPWNWLSIHFPPWKILSSIQFPWRFLEFAVLSLVLLGGSVLYNEKRNGVLFCFAFSSVIMMIWFISDMTDRCQTINIYDTLGVNQTWTGPEYLLEGSEKNKIIAYVQSENLESTEFLSRNANTLKLYCRAGNNSGMHLVTVPVYNYKGYLVTDENDKTYEIMNGDQNRIMFSLPDNFDGVITVVFRDPVWWTAAWVISLIGVITLIGCCLLSKKSCRRCDL